MKKLVLIVFVFIISFLYTKEEYIIIDTNSEQEVTLNEMATRLSDVDVIFFGEFHDNKIIHNLEFEFLKIFYESRSNLIVSFEMFERDVQQIINKYLDDEITEKEFLKNSRPWPNYETDYRNLVEFSKDRKLQVLAANIPRRYAAKISKEGLNALDSLPDDEKKFVANTHKVIDDEYKEKFVNIMKANMAHSKMPSGKMMNFDLFYAAQCIKDDTMAESIKMALDDFPKFSVIHYNGDFHSREHLGTAQKLELLTTQKKIAVIAPLLTENNLSWSDEDLSAGDFLILIKDDQ